jgi:ribokinase
MGVNMSKILISGLVNIETTVKITSFPIEYTPVNFPFFGVNSNPSGVGLNLSFALKTLGDEVNLLSLIGKDANGFIVKNELEKHNIDTQYLIEELSETSHSVVLYDKLGKRQIYCDLKDIQDRSYKKDLFEKAVKDCNIVCLCNINYSRDLLAIAKNMGKLIATDVQVLEDINDDYNADFMRYANILFMSNEKISGNIEDFVSKISNEYNNDIIVVGLGNEGALLYVKKDNFIGRFPAVKTRPVVNTIGAGDSLFAAFIHFYSIESDPYDAIKKAIVFASYKIGAKGAAQGFLSEKELLDWYNKTR